VDNTINENGEYAIEVYPKSVHTIGDNLGSGNGVNHPGDGIDYDVLNIQGGSIGENPVTWDVRDAQALPYVIVGDILVQSGGQLTLEPGVELRFAPETGLTISGGTLIAQGTQDARTRFTSHQSDPEPGDWKGLTFGSASVGATILEYCTVEFGGQTNNANLYINNTSPTIRHTIIQESSGHGIFVTEQYSGAVITDGNEIINNAGVGIVAHRWAQPTITGNTITDNGTGISVTYRANATINYNDISSNGGNGIRLHDRANASINYNDIVENTGYGVYLTNNANATINRNNIFGNVAGVENTSDSLVVDAQYNYWGAGNGPNDPCDLPEEVDGTDQCNPLGNGQPVSNYVDYSDWEQEEITNSFPYAPQTPVPAHDAVNVPLDAGTSSFAYKTKFCIGLSALYFPALSFICAVKLVASGT
jgi:parallel beta-helix repeat protein